MFQLLSVFVNANICRGGLKKCVNVQVFGLSVYVCVCVPVPVHAPPTYQSNL